MKTDTTLDFKELKALGQLTFNNEHNPAAEAFELQIDFGQISSWDSPFKVFVNGELKASFKSFAGMRNRVQQIINSHELQKVA